MVSSPYSPATVRAALRAALAASKEVGARTALTGGTALEAWGVARATQDVDLVFLLPPDRLARFQQALQRHGARFLEVCADPRITWLRVLIRGIQIDWLRAWDLPSQRALRRAVVRNVLGMSLKVLCPEDLILLKLRVGRPRDIDDAGRLYLFCRDRLDQRYLENAIRDLRLGQVWSFLVRTLSRL